MGSFRKSSWKYRTSWSGDLSLAFLGATSGELYFRNPSGHEITCTFIGAGVGIGVGVKISKALKSVGGSFSVPSFDSGGLLYILPGFNGDELTVDDLAGKCAIAEASGALTVGVSTSVMMLGHDETIVGNYKAMALLLGQTVGLGAGATCYEGYVFTRLSDPVGTWEVKASGQTYFYRLSEGGGAEWDYDIRLPDPKRGEWQMGNNSMLINWKSGSREEWNIPRKNTNQKGVWYTKEGYRDSMASQGTPYSISASLIGEETRRSRLRALRIPFADDTFAG